MSNNESRSHYNSKLVVEEWILELRELDIISVYEFPVTEDNISFKCKDEYESFFLYTPEAWMPSVRKDVFDEGFDEINYIYDWTGVQWWQESLPPTYKQLIDRKKQVYVIFDIGLVSEYDFYVNVPCLNPKYKDDLTESDEVSMLLGAIEIEHTHSHTNNKKKFISKLPFDVLDLTIDEILVHPNTGRSKLRNYMQELSSLYRCFF